MCRMKTTELVFTKFSKGFGVPSIFILLLVLIALAVTGIHINDEFSYLNEKISVNREYLHAEREELKLMHTQLLSLTDDSERIEGQLAKNDQEIQKKVRSSFQSSLSEIKENRTIIQDLETALSELTFSVSKLVQNHNEAVIRTRAWQKEKERTIIANHTALVSVNAQRDQNDKQLALQLARVGNEQHELAKLIKNVQTTTQLNQSILAKLNSSRQSNQAHADRINLSIKQFRTRLNNLNSKIEQITAQRVF